MQASTCAHAYMQTHMHAGKHSCIHARQWQVRPRAHEEEERETEHEHVARASGISYTVHGKTSTSHCLAGVF